MKTTILPNGNRAYCFDENEAYITYMHVNEYLKNGINLSENDVVFDVGANIGLFTAHLYERFSNTLNIYSFEPIPDTYKILELNIEKLDSRKIKLFQLGLSDSNKIVEFGYSENSSMLSSAYPFDTKEEQDMIKSAYITTLKNLPPDAPLFLKILKNMPVFVTNFVLSIMGQKAFAFKKIPCQLTTISSLISKYKISSIDLLKIDVEKSELDVINGIADHDWNKIRQTVIEVHDIENRVSKLTNILKKKGFIYVNIIQEPDLVETNIYCIFATR